MPVTHAILAALTLVSTGGAPPNDVLAAELRAKDQALLDAIAPGDRALWAQTLTSDAVYVDENGAVIERAEFLRELTPLPSGVSGRLRIVSYDLRRHQDTALVIHRDQETETYHGIQLRSEYLMTEAWRREGDIWRLAMVHSYVVAKDPPAVAMSRELLVAYVGRYRASPDLTYVIALDGDHLVGGLEGRPPHQIDVEATDVLFSPGQPRTRLIFQRDAIGKVTQFIDRREGEDIVWRRVSATG